MFHCNYGNISKKISESPSADSPGLWMLCTAVCKAEIRKPGDAGHEKRPSKISRQRNLLTKRCGNGDNNSRNPDQTLGSSVGLWS